MSLYRTPPIPSAILSCPRSYLGLFCLWVGTSTLEISSQETSGRAWGHRWPALLYTSAPSWLPLVLHNLFIRRFNPVELPSLNGCVLVLPGAFCFSLGLMQSRFWVSYFLLLAFTRWASCQPGQLLSCPPSFTEQGKEICLSEFSMSSAVQ